MPLPVTDLHLHVTSYRTIGALGEVTARAVVDRCQSLGFRAVGLVEHLNGTAKHPVECMRQLSGELAGLARPAGLDVRLGAELDITDAAGTLRLRPGEFDELRLDFLLAAVHGGVSKSLPEDVSLEDFIRVETRWMDAGVSGPHHVDALAHPWSISRKRPGWSFAAVPADCRDRLVEALAGSRTALNLTHRELNDGSAELADFIGACRAAGVKLSVGSDAHALEAVENAARITAWLESLGVGMDDLYWPVPL